MELINSTWAACESFPSDGLNESYFDCCKVDMEFLKYENGLLTI